MTYNHKEIDKKWQKAWLENKIFAANNDFDKPKYYVLDMFPYPSGSGLHVGHPEGYTATDIVARYKRCKGFNVLHPMGWDSFGLPTENYAIKTGTHPEKITKENIENFRRQLQSIGFSYDWDRELATSDVDYYKWTQWIFVQLYNKGLAYEDEISVNWCPALKTVLANEEIVDGKSEIGGHPVERKPMKQWMLKITEYADRLLEDLEGLDWPESIKELQRNWIGKSEGAEIAFAVDGFEENLKVFTTRPDTLFGATYMVLAPEHPLVKKITTREHKEEVEAYLKKTAAKSDLERTDLNKDKTGIFSGGYAINPINNKKIPIWIADYVLISYGTGAIMAVPAHDQRDWEFATKYDLEILEVIDGGDIKKEAYTGDGKHIQSSFLDGLNKEDAIEKTIQWLEEKSLGVRKTNYKLRDWLFSRQRYWGEPFPILKYEDGTIRCLDSDELPVELPEVERYEPSGTGESPLATIDDWLYIKDPKTGKKAKRETNTMPQWAGSCWYYLRFIDPHNKEKAWDEKLEKYWMPVDLYVGGVEHAVLHLLYARFWHKVLYDLGYVSTKEPFQKLVNQGLILGEAGEKMSKSRGNVINPDGVIDELGADSLRLYEMFMGPLEKDKPWSTKNIYGVRRFLERAWRLCVNEQGESIVKKEDKASEELLKVLHKSIKKVEKDIEALSFNTAISQMMILTNELYKTDLRPHSVIKPFIQILAPFAPHIAEELWQRIGEEGFVSNTKWPQYDEKLCSDDLITIGVQINGKRKGEIQLSPNAQKEEAMQSLQADKKLAKHLEAKEPLKVIYVPGRILNLIIK